MLIYSVRCSEIRSDLFFYDYRNDTKIQIPKCMMNARGSRN
nr:MAG TPA: hypothetical protein [Caudoviricetes sp.]